MTMDRANLVLGREWLYCLCSTLKRSYKHSSFVLNDNGTHILLLGEKNVPPSPLICTTEIVSLSSEIDKVFVCYSLCHFLSNEPFQVCHDELFCETKKGSSPTLHSNLSLQCCEHYNATSIKDKGFKETQLLLSHANVTNNNSSLLNAKNISTMVEPQDNNKLYTKTHLQDVTNINDVIDSHIRDQLKQ